MRKRSIAVAVGGIMTVAGIIWWVNSGDPEYSQACVNSEEIRVEDEQCEDGGYSGGARWFYSGYSQSVPPVGSKMNMTQGSFTKPSGSISTVSRGGFGGRSSSGS